MNEAVAEWCERHVDRPARILYLPKGPYQLRETDVFPYDIIVTQCKTEDLDNKDTMSCLWRLGYEFAAPGCVLLLEIEGGWPKADTPCGSYLKLSNTGWCRWDTMGVVEIFHHIQTLAPWITRESIREMNPNLVTA